MKEFFKDKGIRIFLIIWFGQFVSMIGSGLTGFALSVYIFQLTGQVTQLAISLFAASVPGLLISPIAGALIDRWNRKWVMVLSDTGVGLSTMWVFYLLLSGNFSIWHIYIANAVASFFSAFQRPGYMALPTVLVPKKHFGRVSGLMQMAESISMLLVPLIAGVLITTIDITGVMLIDLVTYAFALLTLFIVHIPKAKKAVPADGQKQSLIKEAGGGWLYLQAHTGLLGLLLIYAFVNFGLSFHHALLTPMILSFSTPEMLGTVLSTGGVGALIGSLIMSSWGGSKRKIQGIMPTLIAIGLFFSLTGLRPNIFLIAIVHALIMVLLPITNGSSHAIWNAKVPPDMQGRVFSIRFMIGQIISPITYLIAGPLADRVFEPMLMPDGLLSASWGQVVGVGPGRGMGSIIMLMGLVISLVAVVGWLHPRVRNVEDEIPDSVGDIPNQSVEAVGDISISEAIPAD